MHRLGGFLLGALLGGQLFPSYLESGVPTLTVTPQPAAPRTVVAVAGTGFAYMRTRLLLDGVGATTNVFRPRKDGTFNVGITTGTNATETLAAEQLVNSVWKEVARTTVSVADVVTPPPPPPTGIPPIPAGYGSILRKDFADGSMGPFRGQTLALNSHIGPGQWMTTYTRYVKDTAHISVHDGYLELKATRRPDGLYDGTMVATYEDDNANPPNRTFETQYSTVRFMARISTGHVQWAGTWGWDPYSSGGKTENEIDAFETLYDSFTFNLHNPNFNGAAPSQPWDTNWHEVGWTKTPTYVALLWDGREIGRKTVSMPGSLALLADCKVGRPWDGVGPDATTPDTVWLQIAWITVDP